MDWKRFLPGIFLFCGGAIKGGEGNVYEWTASDWSARFDDNVVKGGNWNAGPENSRCGTRFGQPAAEGSRAIGFRCCANESR
jgi:formylglycine-generating enzyme required for sulfatase activity